MNCNFQKVTATLTGLAIMSTLAVTSVAPANAASNVTTQVASVTQTATISPILKAQEAEINEFATLINDYRASYGLPPLSFNEKASIEAANWSKFLGQNGLDRHSNPSEWDNYLMSVSTFRSENVAQSESATALSLFNQWKASSSHNAAMLSTDVDSFGFGLYKNTPSDPNYKDVKGLGTTVFYSAKADSMPSSYNSSHDYFAGKNPLPTTDNTLIKVIPKPVVIASDGKSFTIPDQAGVRYYNELTKKFVTPGKHVNYGWGIAVRAIAQDGYRISNGANIYWNNANNSPAGNGYSISKPFYQTVDGNFGLMIPFDQYVDYYVNGKKTPVGMVYQPSGFSATITVKFKPEYENSLYPNGLDEPWVFNFINKTEISGMKNVTFDKNNRKYTIPSVANVIYSVNGTAKSAGTYNASAGETINVSVAPVNSNYSIWNAENFAQSYKFPNISVSAKAPTFDNSGIRYTIPVTTGVEYKVNGANKAAGTYDGAPESTISITAHATSGYDLSGTSSWSNKFGKKAVSAQAPKFDEFNETITIPTSAGVDYYINNAKKSAGVYDADKYFTNVSAKPQVGYQISGTVSWNFVFEDFVISVTPKTPTVNAISGTYTIPSTIGVEYFVNGSKKATGTYPLTAGTHLSIVAEGIPGYITQGNSTWDFQYSSPVAEVKPPTYNLTSGTYTLPPVEGVNYYVNGSLKVPGTYSSGYTSVKIEVKAKSGFILSGTTSWTFDLRKKTVNAVNPTVDYAKQEMKIPSITGIDYYVNGVKKANGSTVKATTIVSVTTKASATNYIVGGSLNASFDMRATVKAPVPTSEYGYRTITIPSSPYYVYIVNGMQKTPGKYLITGTVKIQVKFTASTVNFKASGATSWSFDHNSKVTTVKPKAPTFDAGKNTVKINATTGVNYYINGKYAKPGTYSNSGVGVVLAKASSGYYKTSGTNLWKFDNRNSVKPKAPTFSASKNTVKINATTGVNYYINGKYAKPGTHKNYGTGSVTSKASSGGYKLYSTNSWKFDNRNSVKPKAPTFSTSKNTVKINATTGVKYYINGKYAKTGTYKYKNGSKMTVTAKASDGGYKLYSTTSWKKTL